MDQTAPPVQKGFSIATVAGGCFWCLEAVYDQMKGVVAVESGYIGGHVDHPTYEAVCSGRTGHAEAVRVMFDPTVVSYRELLEVFFVIHDPTQLNRQGHDLGTQYRSGIYCSDEQQLAVARDFIAGLERERIFARTIVTEVKPLAHYWPAEDYHQDFFARNPHQGYCMAVAAPKVAKFRKTFARLQKT